MALRGRPFDRIKRVCKRRVATEGHPYSCDSSWNKFHRVGDALRFGESLDPLARAFCRIFLPICRSHRIANTRAADGPAANGKFQIPNLHRPTRMLPKRLKPSGRFVVPRSREDPAVHDYNPHSGVTMLVSGTNAHDLSFAKRFDHVGGEYVCL